MIETRLYKPDNDEQLLFKIYKSIKEEELKSINWTEQEKNNFIKMQHEMQMKSYSMQYPHMARKIILYDGKEAGCLFTVRGNDYINIVYIALFPEFRCKGIGALLLTELKEEAKKDCLTLKLSVERENAAYRLYSKLGFRAIGSNEINIFMEWKSGYFGGR